MLNHTGQTKPEYGRPSSAPSSVCPFPPLQERLVGDLVVQAPLGQVVVGGHDHIRVQPAQGLVEQVDCDDVGRLTGCHGGLEGHVDVLTAVDDLDVDPGLLGEGGDLGLEGLVLRRAGGKAGHHGEVVHLAAALSFAVTATADREAQPGHQGETQGCGRPLTLVLHHRGLLASLRAAAPTVTEMSHDVKQG